MADTYANPVTNPMGALQQLSNDPAKQMMQQQQEQWQQKQGQLQKLQGMLESSPETNEAERWGAMAQASAKSPPVIGGFGALLANIGGAYGQTIAAQKQAEIKNQEALTKLMESGGLGQGSLTALTQSQLNPYVNVPGVGLVTKTNASVVLPSNMTDQYAKLYQTFYKNALEQQMDNPEEWAKQQATLQLQNAMGNRDFAGGRATPSSTTTRTEGAPTSAPTSAPVTSVQTTSTPGAVKEPTEPKAEAVATGVAGAETPFQKAQVQTESGGNQKAVSKKGALGAWQVMPNTNKDPGFGVTPAKDNSPEELNRVGKEYSDAMVQRYGSEPLGAIAYNMGPGATDKWLASGGQWEKLPQETKNYVGKVITLASQQQPSSLDNSKLKMEEDAAAARGDFNKAKELHDLRQRSAPTANPAPTKYKDTAAQKGREKTAEESAKMYATNFEENVVKPAAAFSNTTQMMQDFNNLSNMQSAIKGGKLKEFMGGEGGKWLMTIAEPGSDLYNGISNAQQAEQLSQTMVNKILLAAKGVQTEGDAQRAKNQITSLGKSEDANKYVEAYMRETSRQLQMREKMGREHKDKTGTYEGYSDSWNSSPIMTEAKGSVKKIGSSWVGLTQYIDKFKQKNPSATDADAISHWNGVK